MEERKIKLKKELEEAREHDRNYWRGKKPVVPFACFGKYDNSCHVERANFKWVLEGLEEVGTRGYSTYRSGDNYVENAIYIDVDLLNEEAVEMLLDYLEQTAYYPSVDDEYTSNMEEHLVDEAYRDGWDMLENKIDNALYDIVMDSIGELTYVESGGTVYINWDKVFERFKEVFKL